MKKPIIVLLGVLGLIFAPYSFREAHAQFTPPAGGGGSVTIPSVTNLLSGNGSGGVADSGVAGAQIGTLLSGSLTQAQILALNATPIVVIAAPGATSLIVVDQFTAEIVAGGTQYAGTGTLGLLYTAVGQTSVGNTSAVCAATFMTSAINRTCFGPPMTLNGIGSSSTVNSGIELMMNTSQDTCAATCGTISYWIRYHVLTGL